LLAHGRKDRVCDPHDSPEVGIEYAQRRLDRGIFDQTRVRLAGVIYQDINRVAACQNRLNTRFDRGLQGDVKFDHLDTTSNRPAPPACAKDLEAALRE
jgi:hypothetical protein